MNLCKDLPGQLDRVIRDALRILGAPNNGILSEDLTVYAFPQMWGSTALGHGGVGARVMTTAQTWVVFSPEEDPGRHWDRMWAAMREQWRMRRT